MTRIDPSSINGPLRAAGADPERELVRAEAAAKNAGGARRPARHDRPLPFLSLSGPSEARIVPPSTGRPPILLGAGLLPSWVVMYRMLLEMEMSEAMRSLLYPEPPPPGSNKPPAPMKSRMSVDHDKQRARQIAERKAANPENRDGKFD